MNHEFQGGSLLNLTSAVELSCSAGAGMCTVDNISILIPSFSNIIISHIIFSFMFSPIESRHLHSSRDNSSSWDAGQSQRARGAHHHRLPGGITTTVYQKPPVYQKNIMGIFFQPTIDYPDLSQAAQITDDSHSPHYKWDRYSAYIRDYTG